MLADPEAPGGRSGCDVAVASVDEVDTYSSTVAGVRLEAIRTGLGVGPHRVLSLRDDRFLFTSNDIGFPLSLIHISEPTRPFTLSRMPSSA